MFRYKLRTLLIILAVAPLVLAGAWWGYAAWRERQAAENAKRLARLFTPITVEVIEVYADTGEPVDTPATLNEP